MGFSNLFLILNLCIWITVADVPGGPCWSIKGTEEPYFVGNGFTCCNNTYLQHPLLPKNEHWRKCLSKQHGNPDDDLPKTLWNAYVCEMSSAAKFPEGEEPTYKDFEAFLMSNYPDDVKNRLLASEIKCEVKADMDTGKKFKQFEECFWKAEEKVCLDMSGMVDNMEGHDRDGNEMVCEPLDQLKNPNHSFMTFAKPCCKGQELPYPLFDVFMDFDRFEIAKEVITCTTNLENTIKKLSPQTVKTLQGPLKMCQVACVHESDGFGGKYDSNFHDLLNFKLKSVSNSVRKIIREKITKFNPQFKLWNSNQTVPMDQAGDVISSQDEVSQIINYCKFHFEATAEAYRAVYEYCYNEEYGIQFRQDILKATE